jgi:hypothetical protein
MHTYLHEFANGALMEFRRHPTEGYIQYRLLRPDGTPLIDRWRRVQRDCIRLLERNGSDILGLLLGDTEGPTGGLIP